ncbi:MAG: hypothetical protein M1819_000092 [Sarea resinae]|nr:MAG: hypothetical protein M1819_000092 [Sarea resinae]
MLPADSIFHECHKHLITDQTATPQAPPPAYTAAATAPAVHPAFAIEDEDVDTDSEEENEMANAVGSPMTIKIDLSTRVVGNNNVVLVPGASSSNISATGNASSNANDNGQAHTVRLTAALLVAAMRQISTMKPSGPFDINMSCGVQVIGSRNVVGPLREKRKGMDRKEVPQDKAHGGEKPTEDAQTTSSAYARKRGADDMVSPAVQFLICLQGNRQRKLTTSSAK